MSCIKCGSKKLRKLENAEPLKVGKLYKIRKKCADCGQIQLVNYKPKTNKES